MSWLTTYLHPKPAISDQHLNKAIIDKYPNIYNMRTIDKQSDIAIEFFLIYIHGNRDPSPGVAFTADIQNLNKTRLLKIIQKKKLRYKFKVGSEEKEINIEYENDTIKFTTVHKDDNPYTTPPVNDIDHETFCYKIFAKLFPNELKPNIEQSITAVSATSAGGTRRKKSKSKSKSKRKRTKSKTHIRRRSKIKKTRKKNKNQ